MAGGDDELRISGIARSSATAPPEAAEGVEAQAAVSAVEGASAPAIEAVAAALEQGTAIDAAREQLVTETVAAHLDPADAAALSRIRAEVDALLEGDPTLDALLK